MKVKITHREHQEAHAAEFQRQQNQRTEGRRMDARGAELRPVDPADPSETLAVEVGEPEANLSHMPEHLPGGSEFQKERPDLAPRRRKD